MHKLNLTNLEFFKEEKEAGMKRIFFIFYIGLGFAITLGFPTHPWAQGAPGEDTADLAKKTQNPVSDLISLPFQ